MEASYHRFESSEDDERDSAPGDQRFLVHVADGGKTRWHHIEDLDAFFTRVYQYHQRHGFGCIMIEKLLALIQYVCVIGFAAVLVRCVKYDVLFANKEYENLTERITFDDAMYLGHQCTQRIGENGVLVFFLLIAAFCWGIQVIRAAYDFFRLSEIRAFYSSALHIKPNELDNMTWHEVQQRLMVVQTDQQMCIHKQELTELDIYNRILRFKNYMIAMVNKEVLPMKYFMPFVGEFVFLTRGLKFNLEFILFWGPWSLFANNYNLKEEYKRRTNREQLIASLERQFLWIGILNFFLIPFVFVWQLLYSFFSYAEILRREPGTFGARRWSMYSRLYLRHFNELSHEFQARLNRGYNPATRYMSSFNSPIFTIVAKNIAFLAGSLLAVIISLTVWDADVFRVEHMLTLMTICTVIVSICRAFIPDENAVYCPEQLMKKVLSQIHYVPTSWHGRAHTFEVRNQFSQLFQYKMVFIIEELVSPIVTPFILMFSMRSRAARMIDFFRNFTVDIAGVGDICSFAQMDVRRHGDPKWQVSDEPHPPMQPMLTAEGGKTELSLMHFAITNPKWKPSQSENKFLNTLKSQAHHDALMLSRNDAVQNPLLTSLQSLGSIGLPQASILQNPGMSVMMSTMAPSSMHQQQQSIMQETVPPESLTYEESMMVSSPQQQMTDSSRRSIRKPKLRGGTQQEGSMDEGGLGLISSVMAGQQGLSLDPMQKSSGPQQAMFASAIGDNPFRHRANGLTEQSMVELAPIEMGISALYMHELYHNRLVHEDRTANWESIRDHQHSGSYHSDGSQQFAQRESEATSLADGAQYNPPPNASQPLLHPSNSGALLPSGAQNYFSTSSYHQNIPRTITNIPLRTSIQQSQRPFLSMTYENPTTSRTTYSDTALLQRSQVEQLTQSLTNYGENVIDSDSDEPPHDFHLPPQQEQNASSLGDLPSLGAPPNYDDHPFKVEPYQPPQL